MSSPTPWPTECGNQSAYPAVAIIERQAASTSRAATPADDGGEPGELDLEQEGVDLRLLCGRFADHVAAGHVGVVAVDQCTDVDDDGVTLDDRAAGSLRGAGGRRGCGPDATIVS